MWSNNHFSKEGRGWLIYYYSLFVIKILNWHFADTQRSIWAYGRPKYLCSALAHPFFWLLFNCSTAVVLNAIWFTGGLPKANLRVNFNGWIISEGLASTTHHQIVCTGVPSVFSQWSWFLKLEVSRKSANEDTEMSRKDEFTSHLLVTAVK